MFNTLQAVIMCGGSGTRLSPLTTETPKQFLPLADDELTMIQMTARRIAPLVNDNITVVTNPSQAKWINQQLPKVQIVLEPEARNTAPALGLSALYLDPNDIMLIFPADHIFANEELLRERIAYAVELAKTKDLLFTLGMTPTHPHTGLGHIERSVAIDANRGSYKVSRFVEKPPYEKAKEYTESGRYYWNGGMFIWRVGFFLERLAVCQPNLYQGLMQIKAANLEKDVINNIFPKLPKISVDYAVLEKSADCTAVLECKELGWNDLGDWTVLGSLWPQDQNQNTKKGYISLTNCHQTICYNQGSIPLSISNINNGIIIKAKNRILLCPKDKSQLVGKTAELFSNCDNAIINLGIKLAKYEQTESGICIVGKDADNN